MKTTGSSLPYSSTDIDRWKKQKVAHEGSNRSFYQDNCNDAKHECVKSMDTDEFRPMCIGRHDVTSKPPETLPTVEPLSNSHTSMTTPASFVNTAHVFSSKVDLSQSTIYDPSFGVSNNENTMTRESKLSKSNQSAWETDPDSGIGGSRDLNPQSPNSEWDLDTIYDITGDTDLEDDAESVNRHEVKGETNSYQEKNKNLDADEDGLCCPEKATVFELKTTYYEKFESVLESDDSKEASSKTAVRSGDERNDRESNEVFSDKGANDIDTGVESSSPIKRLKNKKNCELDNELSETELSTYLPSASLHIHQSHVVQSDTNGITHIRGDWTSLVNEEDYEKLEFDDLIHSATHYVKVNIEDDVTNITDYVCDETEDDVLCHDVTARISNVDNHELMTTFNISSVGEPGTHVKTHQSQENPESHEDIDVGKGSVINLVGDNSLEKSHIKGAKRKSLKMPLKKKSSPKTELGFDNIDRVNFSQHLETSESDRGRMYGISDKLNLNRCVTKSADGFKNEESASSYSEGSKSSSGGSSQDEREWYSNSNTENTEVSGEEEKDSTNSSSVYDIKDSIDSDTNRKAEQKYGLSNQQDDDFADLDEEREKLFCLESKTVPLRENHENNKNTTFIIAHTIVCHSYDAKEDINQFKSEDDDLYYKAVANDSNSIVNNEIKKCDHNKDTNDASKNGAQRGLDNSDMNWTENSQADYCERAKNSIVAADWTRRTPGRLSSIKLTNYEIGAEKLKPLSRNPITHWQRLVDMNIDLTAKEQKYHTAPKNSAIGGNFNIHKFKNDGLKDTRTETSLCCDSLVVDSNDYRNDCTRLEVNHCEETAFEMENMDSITHNNPYCTVMGYDMSSDLEQTEKKIPSSVKDACEEMHEDKENLETLFADEGGDHFYPHSRSSCHESVEISQKKQASSLSINMKQTKYSDCHRRQEEKHFKSRENILDFDPDKEHIRDTDSKTGILNDTQNYIKLKSFKMSRTNEDSFELLVKDKMLQNCGIENPDKMAFASEKEIGRMYGSTGKLNLNRDVNESDDGFKIEESTSSYSEGSKSSGGGSRQDERLCYSDSNTENTEVSGEEERDSTDFSSIYDNSDSIDSEPYRIVEKKNVLSNQQDNNGAELDKEGENLFCFESGPILFRDDCEKNITRAIVNHSYDANEDINQFKSKDDDPFYNDVAKGSNRIMINEINNCDNNKNTYNDSKYKVDREVDNSDMICTENRQGDCQETAEKSIVAANQTLKYPGPLYSMKLTSCEISSEKLKSLTRNPKTHWQRLVDINIDSMAKEQKVHPVPRKLARGSNFNNHEFMNYEHKDTCMESDLHFNSSVDSKSFRNECEKLAVDQDEETAFEMGDTDWKTHNNLYCTFIGNDNMFPLMMLTGGEVPSCGKDRTEENHEDQDPETLSTDEDSDQLYPLDCYTHPPAICHGSVDVSQKKKDNSISIIIKHTNQSDCHRMHEHENFKSKKNTLESNPDIECFRDTDSMPKIKNDVKKCSEMESFKTCCTNEKDFELLVEDNNLQKGSIENNEKMAFEKDDDKVWRCNDDTESTVICGEEGRDSTDSSSTYNMNDSIGSEPCRNTKLKYGLSNQPDYDVADLDEQGENAFCFESETIPFIDDCEKSKNITFDITQTTVSHSYDANEDINQFKNKNDDPYYSDVANDSNIIICNKINNHDNNEDTKHVSINGRLDGSDMMWSENSQEDYDDDYDDIAKNSIMAADWTRRTPRHLSSMRLTNYEISSEKNKSLSRNPITHWQRLVDMNIDTMATEQKIHSAPRNLAEGGNFNIHEYMKSDHKDIFTESDLLYNSTLVDSKDHRNVCTSLEVNQGLETALEMENVDWRTLDKPCCTFMRYDMSPQVEPTDEKVYTRGKVGDEAIRENKEYHDTVSTDEEEGYFESRENILEFDPDIERFHDTNSQPDVSNDTQSCSKLASFKTCCINEETFESWGKDKMLQKGSIENTEKMAYKSNSYCSKFYFHEGTNILQADVTGPIPEDFFSINKMTTEKTISSQRGDIPKNKEITLHQDSNVDMLHLNNKPQNIVFSDALSPPSTIKDVNHVNSYDGFQEEVLNTDIKTCKNSPENSVLESYELSEDGVPESNSGVATNQKASLNVSLRKLVQENIDDINSRNRLNSKREEDSRTKHALRTREVTLVNSETEFEWGADHHDAAIWKERLNPFNINDKDTNSDLVNDSLNELSLRPHEFGIHPLVNFYPSLKINTTTFPVETKSDLKSFNERGWRPHEEEDFSTGNQTLVYDNIKKSPPTGLLANISVLVHKLLKKPSEEKHTSELQNLMEGLEEERIKDAKSKSVHQNMLKNKEGNKAITDSERTIKHEQREIKNRSARGNSLHTQKKSDKCISRKMNIKCSSASLNKAIKYHDIKSHENIRRLVRKRNAEAKETLSPKGNLLLDEVSSKETPTELPVIVLATDKDVKADCKPSSFGTTKSDSSPTARNKKSNHKESTCDESFEDNRDDTSKNIDTYVNPNESDEIDKGPRNRQEIIPNLNEHEQNHSVTESSPYDIGKLKLRRDVIDISGGFTNSFLEMNNKTTYLASCFQNDIESDIIKHMNGAEDEEIAGILSDCFYDDQSSCSEVFLSDHPDKFNEQVAIYTSRAPNETALTDFFKRTLCPHVSHQVSEIPIVTPPEPLYLQTLLKPVQPKRQNVLPVENIVMLVPSTDAISSLPHCSNDHTTDSPSLDSFSEVGGQKILAAEIGNDGISLGNEDLFQSSLECVLEMLTHRGKVKKAFVANPKGEILAKTSNLEPSDSDIKCLNYALSSNYRGMVKLEIFGDFYICFKHEDDSYLVGKGKNELFVAIMRELSTVVGFSSLISNGSCIKEVKELVRVIAQRGL